MTRKIYTLRQRASAGLRRKIKISIDSERGDAFSTLLIGLSAFLVLLCVFATGLDYSVYSLKRASIINGLDASVCAAVQEVDKERSREGLSTAFSSDGKTSLNKVYLNEEKAHNVFFATLRENLNVTPSLEKQKIMTIISNPIDNGANYIIQFGEDRREGIVHKQEDLESIINASMQSFINNVDKHTVYVNGNIHTNAFRVRPYYIVFIRDYEIKGIVSNKRATFICYKGAIVER